MAKTVADVMKMVKENEVKFVDFRFTDTRGKEQHVSVPVSHFDEDKFISGHAFDGSSIAGWKGIEASDMLLKHPDPWGLTAADLMSRTPSIISSDALVASAVRTMEERPEGPITALLVVGDDREPLGVLHLHDCLRSR